MSDFDRQVVGEGLPLVEASAFFIGVKHHGWPDSHAEVFEKYASVRVQRTISDLLDGRMPEGKAGKFKFAAADKTDAELKEEGRKRAVTSMAAEAHRERARRGERFGGAAGSALGALGGAVAGRKKLLGPHKTLGAAAGMAAGYLAGGRLGKELGTERDIRKSAAYVTEKDLKEVLKERDARQKEKDSCSAGTIGSAVGAVKSAAALMRQSLFKLAETEMGQQEGVPGAPTPDQSQQTVTPPQPPPPPPAPEMEATPPTQPVNYMAAEQMAQAAQQANESQFYRERLGKAIAENQQLQQMAQQMQQAADQLQQQVAANGTQVQAATQQAVEANDRAMQHSQEAANMRMALQQLREQVLQVASQEPPAVTQQNMQQAEAAANEQMATAGTPEASPAPGGGAAPGSAPAGAGGQEQAPAAPSGQKSESQPASAGGQGQQEQKTAAPLGQRLGYAALGAGLGLASGVAATRPGAVESAEERVQKLEEQGQEGFAAAVELAKARLQAAQAQLAQEKPGPTILKRMGTGAAIMGAGGPALSSNIRRLVTKGRA